MPGSCDIMQLNLIPYEPEGWQSMTKAEAWDVLMAQDDGELIELHTLAEALDTFYDDNEAGRALLNKYSAEGMSDECIADMLMEY